MRHVQDWRHPTFKIIQTSMTNISNGKSTQHPKVQEPVINAKLNAKLAKNWRDRQPNCTLCKTKLARVQDLKLNNYMDTNMKDKSTRLYWKVSYQQMNTALNAICKKNICIRGFIWSAQRITGDACEVSDRKLRSITEQHTHESNCWKTM